MFVRLEPKWLWQWYESDGDPTPRGVVGFVFLLVMSPCLPSRDEDGPRDGFFGDGVSHITTIYEGDALLHATLRSAGCDLTECWTRSSSCKGTLALPPQREIARDVKVKQCYISADYDTVLKSTAEIDKMETCDLPDRNIITVGAECFRCGKEASGIDDTSFRCLMNLTPTSARISPNVVLSGGTTMFQWILEHMKKEQTTCAPSIIKIKDELPDGSIITVAPNVSWCAKVLFQPIFTLGVHDTSVQSVASVSG